MKNAFTLAEVLITLGIIGVVAAITMPTLISNHKKRVVETKLQKAYSMIAQAMKFSENEHGDSDMWDFTILDGAPPRANHEILNTIDNEYFSKYLKNCNTENSNAIIYGSGIFTRRNQYYQCSGVDIISYPLANGQGFGNAYNVPTFLFTIYLNGNDRKIYNKESSEIHNMLGKNKFLFTYQSNQLYTGGFSIYQDLHGRLEEDKIRFGKCEQPIGTETGGYSRRGEACATMIQRNGWKIPDNYPVSF